MEEAKENLKLLENEAKDNSKFFGGDTIGLLDIVCCFIAFWLPIIQEIVGVKLLAEEEFPKLCKWSHEFSNDSLMKGYLPPKDKLTAFFRGFSQSSTTSK